MERRELLHATVAGAAGLLVGCLGDEGSTEPTRSPGGDGSAPPTTDVSPTESRDRATADDDAVDADHRRTEREPTEEPTDATSTEAEAPDDDREEPPTATDEPGEPSTATDEGTPTGGETSESNGTVDESFEVVGSDCGRGADRADVERGADRVNVDGTIGGRNGCETAELERVTYDDGADELTIAVRTVDDGAEGACMQCIVDVDYRATVEFDDGTPADVRILHDGEHVTAD